MIESLFGGASDGEKFPMWVKILLVVLFIIFVLPVIIIAISMLSIAILALVYGESAKVEPVDMVKMPIAAVKEAFSM